jgi:hypothetical protein
MSDAPDTPTTPDDDLVSRLSRVRPMTHQEDERPNREQLEAGQRHPVSPGPPVPLPRWLWGGKKKPKRRS